MSGCVDVHQCVEGWVVCLSVCLPVCLAVSLPVCLSCLCVYLSASLSACLSFCLYLSVCASVCACVCPSPGVLRCGQRIGRRPGIFTCDWNLLFCPGNLSWAVLFPGNIYSPARVSPLKKSYSRLSIFVFPGIRSWNLAAGAELLSMFTVSRCAFVWWFRNWPLNLFAGTIFSDKVQKKHEK